MKSLLFSFLILITFHSILQAQNTSREPFSSPLKLPFSFSGNFGELRPAHFHSGLDFRTQGRTGIPVYATKEGYVSRISVSLYGYGNCLYLTHPDGNTTVYGHLDHFIPTIQNYIRDKQYYTENFQINVTLTPGEIDVKRGELIAWSGNTGNSGGPHLHFEVRNTKSEKPQNPLFFISGIQDNSAPIIQSLYIYPLAENSSIDRSGGKKRFIVTQDHKNFTLANHPLPVAYGKIGFGIQATDLYSGTGLTCGIYSAELICDGIPVYGFKMDNFSFDQTRYANSQMDYEEMILNNRKIHRLYRQPGNELDIYNPLADNGMVNLEDGQTHSVEIIVSDAFENKSTLKFNIVSRFFQLPEHHSTYDTLFQYDRVNKFTTGEVKIKLPEGALYENLFFRSVSKPTPKGCFSQLHQIHNKTVPLQKKFFLNIKANPPEHLEDKCLIVSIDEKTGKRKSVGGDYSLGWVRAYPEEFGSYAVTVDTIAPSIVSLSIKEKRTLTDKTKIQFKIDDNLSGIQSYRGEIDGKWVLFEYNPKIRTISYIFDKTRMEFGKNHQLSLVVVDNKNNQSEYKANFFR